MLKATLVAFIFLLNIIAFAYFAAVKRFLLFLLLCCYSLSSIGAVVEFHYCMSKLTGATAKFAKQPTKCSKCGTIKSKKACCKDEEKWLKVKDHHQKSSILFQMDAPVFLVQPQHIFKQFKPLERSELESTDDKSPPEIATPALFILHNVFRI